ncbi:MAG: hypothetical protein ABW321_20545 [Polyangiales bacterium]
MLASLMNAYDGNILRRRARNRLVSSCAGLAALVGLFGPAFVEHFTRSRSGRFINDDVQQQIWPFLRFHVPGAFLDDYLADYQLALNPLGWDALYRWSAPLIDPRALSSVLPYGLLLVTLGALGLCAWRLAGGAAAWSCMALCLSASTYLEELAGGLPRAFGYPLVALAASGLIFRSPPLLALVTCLGAAFYYPVGLLAGGLLVLDLATTRDIALHRRAALLVPTALTAALLMAPAMLALQPYAPTLGPGDWATYPEASPEGRLTGSDALARPTLGDALADVQRWLVAAVSGSDWPLDERIRDLGELHTGWILGSVLLLALVGYALLARRDAQAAQLLRLPLMAAIAYGVAWLAIPHLYVPERYLKFVLPPLVALLVPVGLQRLVAGERSTTRRQNTAAGVNVLASLCLIALLGSRGSRGAGLTVELPEEHAPLYTFLRGLPEPALIAGWPETLDSVPFATGRKVLLSRELHLPFHAAYVRETRARMHALLEAYFAREPGPLHTLRERFAVTHLLVDRAHFAGQAPSYFRPFSDELAGRISAAGPLPAVLQQPQAAVYDARGLLVLDLRRISH